MRLLVHFVYCKRMSSPGIYYVFLSTYGWWWIHTHINNTYALSKFVLICLPTWRRLLLIPVWWYTDQAYEYKHIPISPSRNMWFVPDVQHTRAFTLSLLWLVLFWLDCCLQGLYSLISKTSYRQISWSLEAARLDVAMTVSLWNLTGTSAAVLPRYLPNFRAIEKV